MPQISSTGSAMPSSPIRKLMPFANAAKYAGKRVIHLNIGQPDIHTPEVALSELKSDTRTVVGTALQKDMQVIEGLSKYYKGWIMLNLMKLLLQLEALKRWFLVLCLVWILVMR